MARRGLKGRVVPFSKAATPSVGDDKLTPHHIQQPGAPLMPRRFVPALDKGTTIACVLRLAAEHQGSAEHDNITLAEH